MLPLAQPVLRQTSSASEVARTQAEQAAKKTKDALLVPDRVTDTASMESLRESHQRIMELSMAVDIRASAASRDVISMTESAGMPLCGKAFEQSLYVRPRQLEAPSAVHHVSAGLILVAAEAYRVAQSAGTSSQLTGRAPSTPGSIISTLA